MSEEDLTTEEHIIVATFGEQVQNFMNSDVGRYLIGRADQQSEEAFFQFKHCDVNDVEKVRSLQNTILRSEEFKLWLGEAVQDGLHSLNILENRSEE